MSRVPDLERFQATHGLKMCSVRDLIEWRRRRERLIHREETVRLPTPHGDFDLHAYTSKTDPEPHLALTLGSTPPRRASRTRPSTSPSLVRAHSECLTGDVFGILRCDCGPQLRAAMERSRGGPRRRALHAPGGPRDRALNKIRAYALQEQGLDTVEANERLGFRADHRDYGVGAQILFDLGVRRMRLLTNNPTKYRSRSGYGLDIAARVPLGRPPTAANEAYLRAKVEKLLATCPVASEGPDPYSERPRARHGPVVGEAARDGGDASVSGRGRGRDCLAGRPGTRARSAATARQNAPPKCDGSTSRGVRSRGSPARS